jgi:hypothetical protein
MRVVQHVVEQRAEIGLDDIEFTLSHRHNFRKIVDNFWVVRRGTARAVLEIAVHARAVDRWVPTVIRENPCQRRRVRLPPHRMWAFVKLRAVCRQACAIDGP